MRGRSVMVASVVLGMMLGATGCSSAKKVSSVKATAGSARLLDDLEATGDKVFDRLVVGETSNQSYLAVATRGGDAVAYLCDGAGRGVWFTGTAKSGKVDLRADNGSRIKGSVTSAGLTGTLSNAPSGSGQLSLRTAHGGDGLIRTEHGRSVAGLVIIDGHVRGRFQTALRTVRAAKTDSTEPAKADTSTAEDAVTVDGCFPDVSDPAACNLGIMIGTKVPEDEMAARIKDAYALEAELLRRVADCGFVQQELDAIRADFDALLAEFVKQLTKLANETSQSTSTASTPPTTLFVLDAVGGQTPVGATAPTDPVTEWFNVLARSLNVLFDQILAACESNALPMDSR